jgi:hypothetical protein
VVQGWLMGAISHTLLVIVAGPLCTGASYLFVLCLGLGAGLYLRSWSSYD